MQEDNILYGTHRGKKIFKAVVQGTVFSGMPTATTFGNTVRVASYISYAIH